MELLKDDSTHVLQTLVKAVFDLVIGKISFSKGNAKIWFMTEYSCSIEFERNRAEIGLPQSLCPLYGEDAWPCKMQVDSIWTELASESHSIHFVPTRTGISQYYQRMTNARIGTTTGFWNSWNMRHCERTMNGVGAKQVQKLGMRTSKPSPRYLKLASAAERKCQMPRGKTFFSTKLKREDQHDQFGYGSCFVNLEFFFEQASQSLFQENWGSLSLTQLGTWSYLFSG